jgi:hypothetical protein
MKFVTNSAVRNDRTRRALGCLQQLSQVIGPGMKLDSLFDPKAQGNRICAFGHL